MIIKIWNLTILLLLCGLNVSAQFGNYKFMGPMNIPNLPLLYWDDAKNWQVYERDLTSKNPNAGRWVAATQAPNGSEPEISLQCGGQKVTLRKNTTLNLTGKLVSGWGNVSGEPTIVFEENATLNVNNGALLDVFMLIGNGNVHFKPGASLKNKLTFKEAMRVTIAANAQLENPTFQFYNNCILTNYGMIVNDKGTCALMDNSKFINAGAITGALNCALQHKTTKFINESAGTIIGSMKVDGESIFSNKGIIRLNQPSYVRFFEGELLNEGTIEVLSGTTSFGVTGRFTNTPLGQLKLASGVHVLINGPTYSILGRFKSNSITIVNNLQTTQPGKISIPVNSTLEVAGTIELSHHLENNGTLIAKECLFKSGESLRLEGSGILKVEKMTFDTPRGIKITGKQTSPYQQLTIPSGSVVAIEPNALLQYSQSSVIHGTLENQGTFEEGTPNGSSIAINGFFNNIGTFKSEKLVTGSGKVSNSGNCIMGSKVYGVLTPTIYQTSGTLTVNGTITLDRGEFAGTLQMASVPSLLMVKNNMGGGQFLFKGTLIIDLNGKMPYNSIVQGNYYSVINFNTAVVFSQAVLQVKLGNNFVPAKGDVFKIITYQPQMGLPGIAGPPQSTFGRTDLPTLPATLKWDIQYTQTDITLKVVQK